MLPGQPERLAGLADGLAQSFAPLLLGCVGSQRVVDIVERLQHGLLVLHRRFLLLRLAKFEGELQLAALEHRDGDGWAAGILQGAERTDVAEVLELRRLHADAAGEGDAGEEVGFCHTDVGSGGMELRFGLANVRPALRQFRGQTDRHHRWGWWRGPPLRSPRPARW